MVERTYKIVAQNDEQLDNLEQLFLHIELFGKLGASRNLLIRVDGDGAARFSFKDEDDLYLSDYKKLKEPDATKQISTQTTISGTYDFE